MTIPLNRRTSDVLSGRTAIVTGAVGGLAREAVLAFVREGAQVMLVDRDEQSLRALAEEARMAGGVVEIQRADVTQEEEVSALVESAVRVFGGVDILLNGAGRIAGKSLEDSTVADWRDLFEVNVIGTFLPTRACAAVMRRKRYGRIINLSSALARISVPNRAPYAATKAAVSNMTQSFAVELGAYGVTVNAVAPTAVITGLNRDLMASQQEVYRPLIEGTPVGRLCQPEDLAGVFVLLASESSAFITGQTIVVDGGFTVV